MDRIDLFSEHKEGIRWQPVGMHLHVVDVGKIPSVWSIPVSANSGIVQRLSDTLNPEEINKSLRFHQQKHRIRYLVGRIVLRHLLAQAMAIPPRSVRFKRGIHNKPLIDDPSQPISFNLSYTEDHVIIAIDPITTVGIDIEWINADFEFAAMVDACFSKREIDYIGASPERFFTMWTRKEAILKLSGKGIGEHLPSVEVLDGSGEAQQSNVGDTPGTALRLYTFEAQTAFLVSLATIRPFEDFAFYRWQEKDTFD